jgi:hypothetical protein
MDGGVDVKQADVVLVDDFLNYQNPYTLSDLSYYAGKQSLNGPGMTYGVYSIVTNEASVSGCPSYTYDLYGSAPYIRGPWMQYSEQLIDDFQANGGTHPAYPFLTGMGGAHRVAVFGYLGLRLFVDVFNIDPSLPPQISNLHYRTIYWQGHAIDAVSNQTHTTLTRLPQSLLNSNSTFNTGVIPVTIGFNTTVYPLAPNATLIFSNRQPGLNKTIPGNIAQCQRVESEQSYLEGQFPLAAVDGSISTKWQPTLANATSILTVELVDAPQPITSIQFDWAQQPPQSYSVVFSNSSDFSTQDTVNVTSSSNVTVSNPWNQTAAALITPYESNITDVTLKAPVWSGRYARLSIYGALTTDFLNFQNGSGAMVAEWAIVGNSGQVQAAKRDVGKELESKLF